MHLDMLDGGGCGVKAKYKTYNWYTVLSRRAGELLLCRVVWRIHPLMIVIGESKATGTGLHYPPPYLEKGKCVRTRLMRSAAFCVHPKHKTPSLIIAGPRTDQTVRQHMLIGSSVALNDRYMQWAGIWRKV